jgi:glyoxylase-like metal-dependent hydrolase (beta-lactamase superfamily II)
MITIHPIQTGRLRMKTAQQEPGAAGLLRVLFRQTWTDWLPILAWVVVHPEGVFVVDTGETASATELGYYPRWHPYYRTSLEVDIKPEEEIGPQLRQLSIVPERDVRAVVLTHFHTDHVGGLAYFPGVRVLASAADTAQLRACAGVSTGICRAGFRSTSSRSRLRFVTGRLVRSRRAWR